MKLTRTFYCFVKAIASGRLCAAHLLQQLAGEEGLLAHS